MAIPSFSGWIVYITLILLSLLLPLSIFFGRGRIRVRRLEILSALENSLAPTLLESRCTTPPAVLLAKTRYEHTPPLRDTIVSYGPPTTIFVILSALGFYLLFTAVGMAGFQTDNLFLVGPTGPSDPRDRASYQAGTAAVVGAAFLGSYIWSITYLIRRVSNYDLTPLSFLRASGHILLACFIAGILRHVIAAPGIQEAIAAGTLLGVAFLLGLFPNLGIEVLLDRFPQLRLKRPLQNGPEICRSLPLDMIDGIDSDIKFRLGALEIVDVQNLATYNPIMLYLESPYGLFEIIDWIAQAQLIATVGPTRISALRQAGVHTIHELLALSRDQTAVSVLQSPLYHPAQVPDVVIKVRLLAVSRSPHVQLLEQLCAALSETIPSDPHRGFDVSPMSAEILGRPAPNHTHVANEAATPLTAVQGS